jgi:ribosomal protein S18 acetylase RimI-like enzyme
MDGSVEIRPALAQDAAAVATIADEAYGQYVPRIGRRPAPMTADHAALVARGEVWVAEQDGRVRGYIVLRPEHGSLLLESVAVSAALRRRGLGRALIDFAERHARHLGLRSVELYTNALMTENLAYYPKLGYVEYDRRREDGFDRVFFRKRV